MDKLSTYNIFNYLLPGTLFAAAADRFTDYSIIQSDLLIAPFFYYFIGLIISRIGSLFLEPLLKYVGFLVYSDHRKYVVASKKDPKLDVISEANNMYRTLGSLFVCLFLFAGFAKAAHAWPAIAGAAPYIFGVLLFVLFIFSWKKQTQYVTSRIEASEDLK